MRQSRRCTQVSPVLRHSSQPSARGLTSRISLRRVQVSDISLLLPLPQEPPVLEEPPRRVRLTARLGAAQPSGQIGGGAVKARVGGVIAQQLEQMFPQNVELIFTGHRVPSSSCNTGNR